MDTNSILALIGKEISNLQQARLLLLDASVATTASVPTRKGPGRPKGSVSKATKVPKRILSEEGKRRIAAGQKARWSAQKKSVKAAGKKVSTKKTAKKAVAETKAASVEG